MWILLVSLLQVWYEPIGTSSHELCSETENKHLETSTEI